MAMSKEDAVKRARTDLAKRLGVPESEVKEDSVEPADFPDMALGAPVDDEMSGQMISSGYRVRLSAGVKVTNTARAVTSFGSTISTARISACR